MGTRLLAPSLALAALGLGCSDVATPRPQLVVIVDIDAPVPGQISSGSKLSSDATLDTLRVDAYSNDWTQPFDLRDFAAPDPADWPISFGVETDTLAAGDPVRLRIRAFRGELASPGMLNGADTLDPLVDVTVDRLVQIPAPSAGIEFVSVKLTNDCFGVHSTFLPVTATCTGKGPLVDPQDAFVQVPSADELSSVGTWAGAAPVSCAGAPPAGSVCIEGGFAILGDIAFQGTGDGTDSYDPLPLRPVMLSPFYLDATEVTVGTFLALHQAGKLTGQIDPVVQGDPVVEDSEYCTWRGASATYTAAQKALPINCITHATAEAICTARGGSLPTEAQWEFAARGRGQSLVYPWGDTLPAAPAACCLASASRGSECPGVGVEAVGSHRDSTSCGGLGDETADGVLDLAGSIGENLLDTFQPFDAACWTKTGGGVMQDPSCILPGALQFSCRGGDWSAGFARTATPFRYSCNSERPTEGVRCAYAGTSR